MAHKRSRLALILLTLSAAPALSGCPLTFNLNYGGGEPGVGDEGGEDASGEAGVISDCIPKRPATVTAEFRAHGYVTGREPEWKATRQWFGEIGKLPTCPEERER